MKLKQFTYGISVLASALLLTTACNKKPNPTPPEADMEFGSTVDAQWMEETINDIVLMCAQSSENTSMLFYNHNPNFSGTTNTVTLQRDTVPALRKITITFNNAPCFDGKRRNGTIVCDYSTSTASLGANYFRQAGYKAEISLNNYTVDGWRVSNVSGTTFKIENLAPAAYTPSNTTLSWSVKASVKVKNTALNATDSLTWKGDRKMILANSTSSTVVSGTATPIRWQLAQVEWSGTSKTENKGEITGKTTKNEDYYSFIKDESDERFKKVMTCTPNGQAPTSGVNTPTLVFLSQRHPFNKGMMTVTIPSDTKKSPRTLDLGDGSTCDSKATITVDGITYPLNLKN